MRIFLEIGKQEKNLVFEYEGNCQVRKLNQERLPAINIYYFHLSSVIYGEGKNGKLSP